MDELYDWVCERDFFPGVPLGGKVIAQMTSKGYDALRVGDDSIPVRAQYLQDWGHVTAWASLHHGLNSFTLEAIHLSIELWERIEKATDYKFCIGDLSSTPQKVLSDNPSIDILKEPWLRVLEEYRNSFKRRLNGSFAEAS